MEAGKTYRTAITVVPRGVLQQYPKKWLFAEDEEIDEDENETNLALWKERKEAVQSGIIPDNEDEDMYLAESSNFFGQTERNLNNNMMQGFQMDADQIDDAIEGESRLLADNDNLIVACSLLDGFFELESYVFTAESASIGMRTSNIVGNVTPLAIEWCGISDSNGLVAVSSFESGDWGIELYDMNFEDKVEPVATLGGEEAKDKNRGHLGAVLALSRHPKDGKVLASSGASGDIFIWDLAKRSVINKWEGHKGKEIQCLKYNPDNSGVLASASFDHTVNVYDSRISKRRSTPEIIKAKLTDDPESICWIDESHLAVSQSNGEVRIYDLRSTKCPIMNWQASSKEVSTIIQPAINGLLVTGSYDGYARVWDITNETPEFPICERIIGREAPILSGLQCPEEPNYMIFTSEEVVGWDLSCDHYASEVVEWSRMKNS